jgi:hypothetical protein
VTGVSAVAARSATFQKLMALLQAVSGNPLLLQAWMAKYSADKTLTELLRALNLDPRTIELSPGERAQQAVRTAATQQHVGGLGTEAATEPTLPGLPQPPVFAEPVPPVEGL